MTGIFWAGYRMAFYQTSSSEELYSSVCSLSYFVLLQMTLMTSAALTNEVKNRTKRLVKCLPYRMPPIRKQILCVIKANYQQDNNLTLWQFYVFDRAAVIASIGCLVTYGILLGTLGK
ncbi:hypothetical protein AVEN_210747-1 [Araneus ventricosus]|uniref:Gustatory receptor n=1 Tax=Araneus ventricosus TaxID=182803 RepID=A0A4Y2RYI9_ARAVE|nr:hypothetical protein AVEN_210747-1 [Araneus ventricosus]